MQDAQLCLQSTTQVWIPRNKVHKLFTKGEVMTVLDWAPQCNLKKIIKIFGQCTTDTMLMNGPKFF